MVAFPRRSSTTPPGPSFGYAAAAWLAAVSGAAVATAMLWMLRDRAARPSLTPHVADPPRFESPTLPLPPPRELTADALDEFIRWVAAVPVAQAQQIRDAVAAAPDRDAVHAALLTRLFALPAADFGRHLLLLSVLGELNHPESAEHLIRFIQLDAEQILPSPPPQARSHGLFTSFLDHGVALQARAVEMLAHLRTPHALDTTLRFTSAHPERAVRLAALDAWLFNHDDQPDAAERARAAARSHEAMHVGLARRTREGDPAEFDRQVLAFYDRHPAERPPQPRLTRQQPSSVVSLRPSAKRSQPQHS